MAKAKVKLDSTTQKATLKKVMQCISRLPLPRGAVASCWPQFPWR